MPAKVKKKFKRLIQIETAKKQWGKRVKGFIKEAIIELMGKGISPVKGGGSNPANTSGKSRYSKYSESYSDAIKRGSIPGKGKRPVNLKVTGKLHKSIKARVLNSGLVRVWFTDKKAKYHDRLGAGKAKVIRRMLPHEGEEFTRVIAVKLTEALEKTVKKNTKK